MEKDKRLPYAKPLMRIEEFQPNEYARVCGDDELKVVYDDGTQFTSIFWDYNDNGVIDTNADHQELYEYSAFPSPLLVNLAVSKSEGFLLEDLSFVNQANRGLLFYSPISSSSKQKVVYAVRSTDGNDYFFKSKPSLKKAHS
ncbi:MAG: hypothetical protein J5529_04135 [Prevotella sp.]|nr:hypothetical protein [Prevotella sp.]